MYRIFALVLSVIVCNTSFAAEQEISPLQLQLAAWCGAKYTISDEKNERQVFGECAGHRQDIFIIGPADNPVAAKANIDLRQNNVASGKEFLIIIMRQFLDQKDWPEAQRFIDKNVKILLVPEKAERRFGGFSVSLQRGSDVMMTMIVAKGPKAHHPAFDW